MSTSFVKFTPLIGAQDSSQTACYLLEIDSAKILLDCGWNFDNLEAMEAIRKYILC
jgi:Cft2 family RNA processing exonuclease